MCDLDLDLTIGPLSLQEDKQTQLIKRLYSLLKGIEFVEMCAV